jgi:hypothetical protein
LQSSSYAPSAESSSTTETPPSTRKAEKKRFIQARETLVNLGSSFIKRDFGSEDWQKCEQAVVNLLAGMDQVWEATKDLPQHAEIQAQSRAIAKDVLKFLGEQGKMGHAYLKVHAAQTKNKDLKKRFEQEGLGFCSSRFSPDGDLATLRARAAIASWALASRQETGVEDESVRRRYVGTFAVENLDGMCFDKDQKSLRSDWVRAVVDLDERGNFYVVTLFPTPQIVGEKVPREYRPRQMAGKSPSF